MTTQETRGSPRSALLLGASGLVGGCLLSLLTEAPVYATVTLLTRRPLGLGAGKVREVLADFERPESFRDHVQADDVFCCLGTTIKKAGSQDAFRKVDLEAPVAVARAARERGAQQFVIVTAVGADPKSGIFYSRVKGEVETRLSELAFPRGLKVLRPSMILGARSERRPAERVFMAMLRATRWSFVGPLAPYRAIEATALARAMLHAASQDAGAGVHTYEGQPLFALAA